MDNVWKIWFTTTKFPNIWKNQFGYKDVQRLAAGDWKDWLMVTGT